MLNKLNTKQYSGESGMVLVMALLLMAVATLVIIPGLWATSTMLIINLDSLNRVNAYYGAKAGIIDVFWRLKQSEGIAPVFPYSLPGNPVNGMTVTIDIIPGTTVSTSGTQTTYPLQSTAALNGNVLSTVYSKIMVELGPGYPFDYAIASTDGGINVSSNSFVTSKPIDYMADIFANGGPLDIAGSVHGTGYYVTPQTNIGCTNISGGCQSKTYVPYQVLNETWYLQEAQSGIPWPSTPMSWPNLTLPLATPYGTDTYSVTSTIILGKSGHISYIDGNLYIGNQGNVTLNGVIWVNGNIVIDKGTINTSSDAGEQTYLLAHGGELDNHGILVKTNSFINSNGNLNLISDNGTVTLESNVNGSPSIGIIYSPNGAVTVNSNSNITIAAVIGKSVDLQSNVTVSYDTALRTNPPPGFILNVVTVEMTGYSGQ